ncbi:hypothetical protein ACM7G2_27860 [Pseudomonas aeruginosa]
MSFKENSHPAITGWSGNDEFFAFPEFQGFNADAALAVLQGKLAGVMFRGFAQPSTCEMIISKFWINPERQRRSAEAPGSYVGALHWLRPMPDLMARVVKAREAIYSILDIPHEPTNDAILRIIEASQGTILKSRPAMYQGQPVCDRLIRAWEGEGNYALNPHEDESQVTWPDQADFEISQLVHYPICALNLCLENTQGGDLHYWNIRPDRHSKERLGVQHTGIPYAEEDLERHERLVVPIRPGDLYIFNGGLVHAVTSKSGPDDRRATLSCLMSINDRRELVQWT